MQEVSYLVVNDEDIGIYEVVRVESSFKVVQTNILTPEKAAEACKTWREREQSRVQ